MTETPKIRGVLTRVFSFRDRAGNVYNAWRYVDCASGIEVKGTLGAGGDSNIYGAARYLYRNAGSVLHVESGSNYRFWEKLTKSWPYGGCLPSEIAKFIKLEIKRAKGRK